jgi:hypothetical protein
MKPMHLVPVFGLDHEARKQIAETRATILEHLRAAPDDFTALVLADVIGEIDPERDQALAAHRMRFRATRADDWRVRARELGLDGVLFHLAHEMTRARVGRDAVPAIERYATAISEARAAGVAPGHIDASCVPGALARDRRTKLAFHPSGHLASATIRVDARHHGELVLAERPGTGHYTIVEVRGGYGTMIRDDYRDGKVTTTLNTPWHDGTESTETQTWTRWVKASLCDLARLAGAKRTRR